MATETGTQAIDRAAQLLVHIVESAAIAVPLGPITGAAMAESPTSSSSMLVA